MEEAPIPQTEEHNMPFPTDNNVDESKSRRIPRTPTWGRAAERLDLSP